MLRPNTGKNLQRNPSSGDGKGIFTNEQEKTYNRSRQETAEKTKGAMKNGLHRNDKQLQDYHMGGSTIYANRDVSFSVEKGELAIILGSSGAGKSTVLNILGGMDSNDSGKVIIDGKDISKYSRTQLTAYRRTDVGFVFQFYNLVQNLTAKENVELASEIVEHALDPVTVLKDVGLADRINNFPAQLSGGEQQRVAIARAIAKNPKILLCDEPTGALDYNTGKQVLQILQDMSRQKGATVIIVTHNAAIAPIADRVIHMHDARVSRIEENPNPKKIADIEW